MKKISLFTFLLFSILSFAQSKFIEVEVTDTISLKPLTFQCNIYLVNEAHAIDRDTTDPAYDADPMAAEKKEKKKLQEIKRKLEAKNIR